jgi:anti-sigma B factor antagonist
VSDNLLKVRVYDTDTAAVVVADGEVDLATVPPLEQAVADGVRRAADAGTAMVVVDLSGVTFMGSDGLRVLMAASETDGTTVRLVVTTHAVTRLLQLSGTDTVLDVHPDLNAALTI